MNDFQSLKQFPNVIFDLGGVILNLDYHRTFQEFSRRRPEMSQEGFIGQAGQLKIFSDYEVGKMTTVEFREKCQTHFQFEMSDSEFDECWNAMLIDIPLKRIKLLEQLKLQGKRLVLLSNINEIHEWAVEKMYQRLNQSTPFFSLFEKVYYSHRIQLRKPHREVFDLVLMENQLLASETLFIDDSHHHIVGAGSAGICAHHLASPQTIEEIFSV